MSVVLGVNAYHAGASACLIVSGEIRFAIAEERLNRRKYYAGFPKLAIEACLSFGGVSLQDIDYVAVGRDSRANLEQKFSYTLKHPLMLKNLLRIRGARNSLDDLKDEFVRQFSVAPGELRFKQVNVEHHLAHTASAFFASGWDRAAGITIDGSGDFVTCMFSECSGKDIRPVHRIYVPNSLGSFYYTVCQFIGYKKYGDEGKVMGLAPLGKDCYSDFFNDVVQFEDGQIHLNTRYFLPFGSDQGMQIGEDGSITTRIQFSEHMAKVFGEPRDPMGPITQRDMDIAFGLQKRFEEVYFELLAHLHRLVPCNRVVLAGGCALNSVANGKIAGNTPFPESYVQPAAGDDGLAMGAALYVSRNMLNEGATSEMDSAYLGNAYPDDMIEQSLRDNNVSYEKLERSDLLERTARHLLEGRVVGWFQGRGEWGPRALGNRSIICHPGYPDMKRILNARIKHREEFRPFAPVVRAERQTDIFESGWPTPYMMHVYDIRPEWRERLSAVTHVDGTGRVQTLTRPQNPLFYDLIMAFEKASGIPVLLNTSFNENEPIVERPSEAIDCFLRTKMDLLVIGSFLCTKQTTEAV